jgi:hypothetical protein
MSGGAESFKITSVWVDSARRYERVQQAVCSCGRSAVIHDSGQVAKPPEMMAAKFRQKGWRIAARRGGDQCPACAAGKSRKAGGAAGVAAKTSPRPPPTPKPGPLSPAQKRVAYCRIAGVTPAARPTIKPQEPKEAKMKNAPVAADPPRQPDRADWRRIRDALDVHYLPDQGRYAKDGSDRKLAAELNLPRAWVAEERERAYGPDQCEADGQDLRQCEALQAEAKALEQTGLDLATKAEALGRAVELLRVKLAVRGVA